MKAFQKQAETHLTQNGTGLLARALIPMMKPSYCISKMALCTPYPRKKLTMHIMFVVFGLLTSAARMRMAKSIANEIISYKVIPQSLPKSNSGKTS